MKTPSILASLTLPLALLSGCDNGGSSKTPSTTDETEKTETLVEATGLNTGTSSAPVKVYYDLDTATVINITEAEEASNSEWDIAFKRTKVYLNRYGDTPVTSYFTGNADDFYDADGEAILDRFVNATADSEFDAFAAYNGPVPAEAEFHTDSTIAATDGFYTYDPITHTVSANPDAYFVVRSADTFSKFNVTSLTQDGFAMSAITLNIAHQTAGATEFADAVTLDIDATTCTGDIYVDLDTQQIVTESDTYDISIPCAQGAASFEINLAQSATAIAGEAASIPGVAAESVPYYTWLNNVTDVLAIVEYGDPRSSYGWAEYGINGGHSMWANFAIYVIQTPNAQYKFQITGYYDPETAASGTFSIRFDALSQ